MEPAGASTAGDNVALLLFLVLPIAAGIGLSFFYRSTRHVSGPVTWQRLVVGNGLLLFLLTALVLLFGEVYFRFFYDSTDSLNYTKVSRRWLERYWQVNKADLRDDQDYSFNIAEGKRRVTLLGDSFTAGHGVKNLGAIFPQRLRRSHPEWEVHMLARPGFETVDETEFLKSSVQKGYELDLVVLVYCLNDISDMVKERRDAVDQMEAELAHQPWLAEHSYLLNVVAHRLKARKNPFMKGYFDIVRQAYNSPLWGFQQQRLRDLEEVVKSRGGRLAVVTFPFLHALGPDYPYRVAHEKLNAYWQERGIPHLDLWKVFGELSPDKVTVSPLDAHPNEAAHGLAATAIDRFVSEQLAAHPRARKGINP